jgi:mycofactocin glycosyltransferase
MTTDSPGQEGTHLVGRVLEPSADLRRRDNGAIFIGGSPLRIIRLSAAGSKVASEWFRGTPVGSSRGQVDLATRLLDAGMVHLASPKSSSPDPTADLTIVVPVKDDQVGLERTLQSLGMLAPFGVTVIVVDDGSKRPLTVAKLSTSVDPSDSLVRLIRRAEAGGPGTARNDGAGEVATAVIAFVDAGVEVSVEDLRRLSTAFDDPGTLATAPRIVSSTEGSSVQRTRSAIERYEQTRSPLDLGTTPAMVGPGRRVSYVPSACLLVRTSSFRELDGFDEGLRYGEDVDLVWRLSALGRVHFDPSVEVHHPPRGSLSEFVRQRVGYGSAAGPLAVRHGSAVAPVHTSTWSMAVAGLLAAGHPLPALLASVGTSIALTPKLGSLPDARVEAALLTGRGHGWALRSIAAALPRSWWPMTLAALVNRRSRRTATVALAVGMLQRIVDRPPRVALDLALGLVDDVSYGSGVWLGSWRARTWRALAPRVANWPPKEES